MNPTDEGRERGEDRIVMELDSELRHVRASEAALAMVGLPAEALVGRTSGEAGLPPEVVDPLESELREVVTSGVERQLELQMPTVDGPRWLHLRLVPVEGPDGPVVTLLATDVTARKHAELRMSGAGAAFRALVEDSMDPIALVDADMRITFANQALERATGRDAAALLGRPLDDAGLPGDIAARWEQAVRAVLATGDRVSIDFRLTTVDGPRWFSGRLLPDPGAERGDGQVIVICTDITDRVNREAEQAALRRVATVVAREADLEEIGRVVAQEAALLLNATGSAVYRFETEDSATCIAAHPPAEPDVAVPAAVALTPASATGRTARTGRAARVSDYRVAAETDPSIREVVDAGLISGIAAPLWTRGELWGALTAGSSEPDAFGSAEERRLAAFAELAAIAVANAETRAELDRLADTDPLTGLANRRAFTQRLAGEVERARRHGHSLALAILDLDDFKRINDTLGHQTGDAVLAAVGRTLTATTRAGELVARMGGEEFAWILPQVDVVGGVAAVERACAAIATIEVDGASGITCSAGVCDIATAPDAEELMRQADRALYRAKRGGRDRVEAAG